MQSIYIISPRIRAILNDVTWSLHPSAKTIMSIRGQIVAISKNENKKREKKKENAPMTE